jgi:hypothetical protein
MLGFSKKFGGYAAEKGKRSKYKESKNILGKTKATAAAAEVGVVPEPE